jgi:hypothetical protein
MLLCASAAVTLSACCYAQLVAEKANLEQGRLQDAALRNAIKAELELVRKQGEERHKALREKDKRLSDNDTIIKDLEKSRRCSTHAAAGMLLRTASFSILLSVWLAGCCSNNSLT